MSPVSCLSLTRFYKHKLNPPTTTIEASFLIPFPFVACGFGSEVNLNSTNNTRSSESACQFVGSMSESEVNKERGFHQEK